MPTEMITGRSVQECLAYIKNKEDLTQIAEALKKVYGPRPSPDECQKEMAQYLKKNPR